MSEQSANIEWLGNVIGILDLTGRFQLSERDAVRLREIVEHIQKLEQLGGIAVMIPHATTQRDCALRLGNDTDAERWGRYTEKAFELAHECGIIQGTYIHCGATPPAHSQPGA